MYLPLPDLLTPEDLRRIEKLLSEGEFVDGGASADPGTERIKRNLELDAKRSPGAEAVQALVLERLGRRRDFVDWALPRHFSRPIFSRYETGMEYGLHADDPILKGGMRTDVSVTIFLSDPAGYTGGELMLEIGGSEIPFKLPAGGAVAYTTGLAHRVARVTSGRRHASVIWCQSLIADPHRREILSDFQKVSHALTAEAPEAGATQTFLKAYYNLFRLWAEG